MGWKRVSRKLTRSLPLVGVLAASALSLSSPAQAFTLTFECTVPANTWCMDASSLHSWSVVLTGQYNFLGSPGTSAGWWCSKIRNPANGAEYGRKCDFAYATQSYTISPPTNHLQALGANGDNGSTQHIIFRADTP